MMTSKISSSLEFASSIIYDVTTWLQLFLLQFPLATTAPEIFSKQRLDEMGTTSQICKNHNNLEVSLFNVSELIIVSY